MGQATGHHAGALGRWDLALFTVSAILLLDPLLSTAAMGVSSLFWWLFLSVVFFVPSGLVAAELGTTYPEQGGIYAWVRDAFGKRWGSRVSWAYWSNVAAWNPAMFILFTTVMGQLFWPAMGLAGQIAVSVVLTWVCVWFNVIPLARGKWIPSFGALTKMLVIAALIGGGVHHALVNGMANKVTFAALMPDWGESLKYVPAVIYGMLGFELVSASSDEIKHPASDLPWAIAISGVFIALFYTLGTLGILVAIPVQNINLVEGLIDTMQVFFAQLPFGHAVVLVLGIGTLYTFFSSAVTWTIGTNRAMAEAAQEGEFPGFLGIEHRRNGTPVGAALCNGVICTLMLLLYGFLASSNEGLFWTLFAFSAAIFLVPYILMMLAFIKLRHQDRERRRPFRIPGPEWLGQGLAASAAALLTACVLLILYVPGQGVDWPILAGTTVFFMIGELLIRCAEKSTC